MDYADIQNTLGDEASSLLNHVCETIGKERLHVPGPGVAKKIFAASDRPKEVQKNLDAVYGFGRLGGTGYLSILPVDQGIEHSAHRNGPTGLVKLAFLSQYTRFENLADGGSNMGT